MNFLINYLNKYKIKKIFNLNFLLIIKLIKINRSYISLIILILINRQI